MAPRGFEPATHQSNASNRYRYTTIKCVYVYTYERKNIYDRKKHLLRLSPSPPAIIAQCILVDKYHRDS
jgi:hypothetical protein